jgi:hypothetical protein
MVIDELYSIASDPVRRKTLLTNGTDQKINVSLVATKSYFDLVMSARTCWIAHYEIWLPVLGEIDFDHFLELIPCHGDRNQCKYELDMKARIEGRDPGIPCPIWTKDQKEVDRRLKEVGESYLTEYYRRLV